MYTIGCGIFAFADGSGACIALTPHRQFLSAVPSKVRVVPYSLQCTTLRRQDRSSPPVGYPVESAYRPTLLDHGRRMQQRKGRQDCVTEPLREALIAYCRLPQAGTARVSVARRLFGPLAAKSLMPALSEIAKRIRLRGRTAPLTGLVNLARTTRERPCEPHLLGSGRRA